MTVKPLSDRVLVLPNPAETTTASGLIIPDSAKEKPAAGKVVAVGPGTAEVKMEVKVGDEVEVTINDNFAGEIIVEGDIKDKLAEAANTKITFLISAAEADLPEGLKAVCHEI